MINHPNRTKMSIVPKALTEIVGDGEDIFVIRDGVKIAKRGHPGTPDAGKWISLDPHWSVTDDGNEIELQHYEVLHQLSEGTGK